MDDEARDADVSEGSRSPRTPPEERVAGAGAWRGPGGTPMWRSASLYRRNYRAPPQHGSNTSTPCSTRSTSSSCSLSPEYPPHRNKDSPSRRRARRLRHESMSREGAVDPLASMDLGLLDDPREGILRRGLRGLSREDSVDSDTLARRFMARDESFESLFACQQATGRRR